MNTTKTERVFMWTFKASFDGYLNKLSVSIGVKASSQKAAEDAAREALELERKRRGEMLLALTEVTEVHP